MQRAGDNGGPGTWQCPDAWVGGTDTVIDIPPIFFPFLESGTFNLEFVDGEWCGVVERSRVRCR